MPLDDLSAIVSSALSASSESELIDNFKTFSSKRKELSGRVIDSDIAVLGNGENLHKRNSADEKVFLLIFLKNQSDLTHASLSLTSHLFTSTLK